MDARGFMVALAIGAASTTSLWHSPAAACPMPSHVMVAPDTLPPRATIYLIPWGAPHPDPDSTSWTTSADWPWVVYQRAVLANYLAAARGYGESGDSAVANVRIGNTVIGTMTLSATGGEVELLHEEADGWRLSPSNEVVPRRVSADARRPWTRVSVEPDASAPYFRDPRRVGRDEPIVSVAIAGEGVGIWSIATPRCQEHIVRAGVTGVPVRCLDHTRQLVVVARAFDGTVQRTNVRLATYRPSRHRSPCAGALLGAAVVALALLGRRRRRGTFAIPG